MKPPRKRRLICAIAIRPKWRALTFPPSVRRWLSDKYGADALYEGGLVVKTTLDLKIAGICR